MKNGISQFSRTVRGGSRRQFLRRIALATAALSFPYIGKALGANDRINIACIGVGGKGDSDSRDAADCGGNIVALCDVDENDLSAKTQQFKGRFPDLRRFNDYRVMFDKIGNSIDAVTISTPDHNHGLAIMRAMKLGKHCFCQKPLVQTVAEARAVRQLANQMKLATQMGNQGSAADGLRRAVEVIQAGVIGKPLELHVWSNRPIWPQGLNRPLGSDPVPATLNWDAWLGPAADRPYKGGVYHNFNWRGWHDFGTGALGDMACHTVNMPFRALNLGYPNVVECELASRAYPETFPKTSRIRFEFPARAGLPPLKFWWYDGNPKDTALRPLRPDGKAIAEILGTYGELPASGALIIGEKGRIFSPDDYGARFYVALEGQTEFVAGEEHEACKAISESIPRSPGHLKEWFAMMQGGPVAYSNFDFAASLTEVVLLGCIALRVGEGHRMEWDGPNMTSPNTSEAAQFVTRHNRKGWES